MIKKLLITCVSYLLILCLLKILFVPLYQFKPQVFPETSTKVIVRQIAFCESGLNPNAYVANDGGTPSAGILQFKLATFHYQWHRLVNPDFDMADASNLWREPTAQFYLAEKMVEANPNNLRAWYNCSKKLNLI